MGYWSYSECRYVERPKPKPEPIFRGAEKRSLVRSTMTMMSDWRLSPFEHEGAARASLRRALCLAGFDWYRSDNEAAEVVREVLAKMGARRPTWDEGQVGYAIAKENCNWCRGAIDPALRAAERQYSFCSDVCARAAIEHRQTSRVRMESRMNADAWDVIQRLRNPEATCAQCSRVFRPVIAEHNKFCSLECSAANQHTRPDKICKECGKSFKPHSSDPNKGHFCSLACRRKHGFTTRYEKTCVWCSRPFTTKMAHTQCCSYKCTLAVSKLKAGHIKRIAPPIFDYLFARAA